jgi:hypothetical protein
VAGTKISLSSQSADSKCVDVLACGVAPDRWSAFVCSGEGCEEAVPTTSSFFKTHSILKGGTPISGLPEIGTSKYAVSKRMAAGSVSLVAVLRDARTAVKLAQTA